MGGGFNTPPRSRHPWEQAPPSGSRHPPPRSRHPPWLDPPQLPPWVWAWTRSPSTSPLDVGLETSKACWDTTPPPPLETCCKACWDTTCNACWDSTPSVNRITDTGKNITFPQLRLQVVITILFTTRRRSLGQGNLFTPVSHSVHGAGGVGLPACITGHMTRGWGSASKGRGGLHLGVCIQGDHPARKVTGTHPTGMLPCLKYVF